MQKNFTGVFVAGALMVKFNLSHTNYVKRKETTEDIVTMKKTDLS